LFGSQIEFLNESERKPNWRSPEKQSVFFAGMSIPALTAGKPPLVTTAAHAARDMSTGESLLATILFLQHIRYIHNRIFWADL
jgi:hypothetical protein